MKEYKDIVGAMVGRIYMDDKHLTLITDKGKFSFRVSKKARRTFFCDFYGVNHLFGAKIVGIKEIPVSYHNQSYYASLPRYRSRMKMIQQRALWDMKSPLPAIYGYEILSSHGTGKINRSIFSFQDPATSPIAPTLIPTPEHVIDERYRVLKSQFRISPRR